MNKTKYAYFIGIGPEPKDRYQRIIVGGIKRFDPLWQT